MELLGLGYVGILILSFALNMLPFMGPSNMVLAGALVLSLPWANPFLVGLLVALAASSAKLIHFYTVFFIGKALGPEVRAKFERYGGKTGKVGPLLLFIAAASPVPDEPIVIPLGLLKYSPVKFFAVFFSGKVVVTVLGAYLGSRISLTLSDLVGDPLLIGASVALTIIATYVLMKVDLEKVVARLVRGVKHPRQSRPKT